MAGVRLLFLLLILMADPKPTNWVAPTITASAGQDLLIADGLVVNPRTRQIRRESLLLRGGRIVQRFDQVPTAYRGARIDAHDRYVMPGLVDMHVHAAGNRGPSGYWQSLTIEQVLRRQLYCGVVNVLDLFNDEQAIFQARARQRRSGAPAARLYAAGPALTCSGGHGTEYRVPTRVIDSPAQAERIIKALAQRKPDVIKIVYDHYASWMPTISLATLQAALKAASKQNVPTVVHVGTWSDVREALQGGASAVTHVPPTAVPPDIAALFIRHKAFLIPALTVQTELAHFSEDSTLLQNPLLAAVTQQALLADYCLKQLHAGQTKAFIQWQQRSEPIVQANIRALSRQHVRFLVGTDSGNPGTFHGYSVHRELQLLVKAGLSSWQALAAATTEASVLLGRPIGTEVGDSADLLVLRQSPVTDIRHTASIDFIIQQGKLVQRQNLLQ